MRKLFRNRVIIMIVCVIFAFVAVMYYTTSLRASINPVKVVRVAKGAQVLKGKQIKANQVELVDMSRLNLPSDACTELSAVVDKYATADMFSEQTVLNAGVTAEIQSITDAYASLDGNKVIVSVAVKNQSDAVADTLRPGDIVSPMIGNTEDYVVPPKLTFLEVVAVSDSSGSTVTAGAQDKDSGDSNKTASLDGSTKSSNTSIKTISVLANREQALLLAKYDANSRIHFALAYRGDSKSSQKFLDEMDKVFK